MQLRPVRWVAVTVRAQPEGAARLRQRGVPSWRRRAVRGASRRAILCRRRRGEGSRRTAWAGGARGQALTRISVVRRQRGGSGPAAHPAAAVHASSLRRAVGTHSPSATPRRGRAAAALLAHSRAALPATLLAAVGTAEFRVCLRLCARRGGRRTSARTRAGRRGPSTWPFLESRPPIATRGRMRGPASQAGRFWCRWRASCAGR